MALPSNNHFQGMISVMAGKVNPGTSPVLLEWELPSSDTSGFVGQEPDEPGQVGVDPKLLAMFQVGDVKIALVDCKLSTVIRAGDFEHLTKLVHTVGEVPLII